MKRVELTVVQKPVSVEHTCPHCGEVVVSKYDTFCGCYGEACDWTDTQAICIDCGGVIEYGGSQWN